MKTIVLLFALFLTAKATNAQSSRPSSRERIWIYDVNITRDAAGRIVRVDKIVFGKGSPGVASQIRYFETKEKRDAAGNVIYSTRELIGENNVPPDIVKQYGSDSAAPASPDRK